MKMAIFTGSIRPGRNGEGVAGWVYGVAKTRKDAEVESAGMKDSNLPLRDQAVLPSLPHA